MNFHAFVFFIIILTGSALGAGIIFVGVMGLIGDRPLWQMVLIVLAVIVGVSCVLAVMFGQASKQVGRF